MQKRRWKDCECQGLCMVPRKHSLPDPVELMHIGTHRDWGRTHKICIGSIRTVSPGIYLQLVPAGNGQISFLQWSATGYINHMSRQSPCPGTVRQHKNKLHFVERERGFLFHFVLVFVGLTDFFVCFDFYFVCVSVCKVWKRKQMQEVVGEGGGEQ